MNTRAFRRLYYFKDASGLPVTGLFGQLMTAAYWRAGEAPVAVSLTNQTFVEVDPIDLPGVYVVEWPAALVEPGVVDVWCSISRPGAFADFPVPLIERFQRRDAVLQLVTVGPGATTTTLPVTTASYAGAEQWSRRTLQVVTGAAAGERVQIVTHVADLLEVAPPLTVAPEDGALLLVE